MQLLLHVPALERSNALFATAVAYAYLVAEGLKVTTIARAGHGTWPGWSGTGTRTSTRIADELRMWTA